MLEKMIEFFVSGFYFPGITLTGLLLGIGLGIAFGAICLQARKVTIKEVLQFFRIRLMWVCGAMQYIRLAVMTGIAFWLPTLLIEERGLSLQITGLLIAMRALLVAPSNIVGGYFSDRLKNPVLVIRLALIVLAITTILLVVVDNITLLIIVIIINSIFVQMYFGPLFAIPVEILGKRTTGTSTGFSNLFANIGGFTSVFLLGALKEATGSFLSGFLAIAIACIVGLGFTIVLGRMRRSALAQPTTNQIGAYKEPRGQ
ncbi:MFS transporter [Chloroflexota bacterium]